eukprot:GHRQ01027763.1.p1 GENE.GHRQ01027763.1~~GHRQ01027763.1.p1  ORF type:complete len:161 (+),score=67.49 GHRQ01027763.1:245-727(+)
MSVRAACHYSGHSLLHAPLLTFLCCLSHCCNNAAAPPLQSVLVHQLSRHSTQNPFRKNRGRVQRVAFHPLKPFFFVATQNAVRIYNLAKQALAKKLLGGSGVVSCMALHPSGDHVIVGSEDKRLAWWVQQHAQHKHSTAGWHCSKGSTNSTTGSPRAAVQ